LRVARSTTNKRWLPSSPRANVMRPSGAKRASASAPSSSVGVVSGVTLPSAMAASARPGELVAVAGGAVYTTSAPSRETSMALAKPGAQSAIRRDCAYSGRTRSSQLPRSCRRNTMPLPSGRNCGPTSVPSGSSSTRSAVPSMLRTTSCVPGRPGSTRA
jgi:hypothetical protein